MAADPSPASPGRTTLVTGAAGFAGFHLLNALAGHGPIVGWHRPGGNNGAERPRDDVAWRAVDITDGEAVRRAVAEAAPERIFHLAGAPSVAESWTCAIPHLQVNVRGTNHLLDAVRLAGQSCRVVVVTSAQVYAVSETPVTEDAPLVPHSPYGLTKLAQDQLASAVAAGDHLEVMIARPFNHIGPHQAPAFAVSDFARQIARIERGLAPPTLRVGNLSARRDFTDVRDVVAAYVRIMDGGRPGRAYNVCSGHARPMQELLDRLLALSTTTVGVEVDTTRLRPADVPVLQGDATRIRSELDWTPMISLDQTLGDTLDYWRDRITRQP